MEAAPLTATARQEEAFTMASKATNGGDPLQLVPSLTEIGSVDTVYRDVYLDRARTLLGGVLSLEDFRRIERQRADLAALPLTIARAMEKANWPLVKELSGRAQALRGAVESQRSVTETARGVYVVTDVRLDPFSPGLQPFAKIPAKDLPALRSRTVKQLTALERTDPPWRDFYAGRRDALQALTLTASEYPAAEVAAAPVGDAREAAAQALKAGDMSALEKLADAMVRAASATPGRPASPGSTAPSAAAAASPSTDLLTSYSDDTLARARRLGLGARRLESRAEVAPLRQYAWNPLFADESGRIGIKQVSLPTGTPEAFRERLEMLMIHPLVNSGGARHLPTLVAEDVLVEDFPDPGESDPPAPSELLAALGLASRRGLARTSIEQALLDRGAHVLEKELGLDPRIFRLVCIPPDVHLRLGEAEGWGRQPLWTHFDGYLVMADGRLRALAGGNARFGGLYDLVGHSRDYESDRMVARFAVVRRERMVAW
jgi:hypothetical protein